MFGDEVHGGGTVIPWNSHLLLIEPGRFASAVVGLEQVEIIRVREESSEASTLSVDDDAIPRANCRARNPMSLALLQVDDGEGPDIIVQDPCGSWFARYTAMGFEPARSSLLETIETSLYMESIRDNTVLLLGNYATVHVAVPADERVIKVQLPGVPLTRQVTRLFVPLASEEREPSSQVLVQRTDGLAILTVRASDGIEVDVSAVVKQELQPPYLKPFEAYDQLTDRSSERCSALAIGIGLFSREAGGLPRVLQTFQLDEAALQRGTYRATDFIDGLDVLAIGALVSPEPEYLHLLGIVHRDSAGYAFSLYGQRDCDVWMRLSTLPIDFDVQSPPSPAWGEIENVPLTTHIRLIASSRSDAQAVELYHYDGYAVRIMRTELGSWATTQRIDRIHRERSDLSFRL